jgi:hypothetical protein
MSVDRYRVWEVGGRNLFHHPNRGYFVNSDPVRNNRVIISELHIKACAFIEIKLYNHMICPYLLYAFSLDLEENWIFTQICQYLLYFCQQEECTTRR